MKRRQNPEIPWQTLPSSGPDLKKMHLRGQVKSITSTEYGIDEKSGGALKDDPKRTTTTFFNDRGNIAWQKITQKSLPGVGTPRYMEEAIYYSYNKEGKISQWRKENDGHLTDQSDFKYTDNLVEEKSHSRNVVRKYDNQNNNAEEEVYLNGGVLLEKFIRKYDNRHQMTEEFLYSRKGELVRNTMYRFDESGNLVEKKLQYYGKPDISETITAKYNSAGDETEGHRQQTGKPALLNTYEYVYDLHSNWIKKTTFKNNRQEFVMERRITYFK